ncbi:hypothetical protein [Streptomyces sp. ISL-44]|uniref:hypothetical protein n=1 Tax=Streptomyces sp. ISL-44 TaxID=2819184 RepID=UPI00203587C7|nr:hypothetical protein [Streptomyces sp. ISL-44]
MTEQQNDAVTGPAAEQDAPVSARPPRRVNRRTLALVAGGLGLAVLAGGGFWAAGRIDQADRTSPTRYWVPDGPRPTASATPVPTVPPNELTGKLLPVPASYELGPDLDDEGNDFYVSGERAVQAVKDSRTGLSAAERAERDKAVAELKLKGVAGRSYTLSYAGPVIEIELTQADPQALVKFADLNKKLLDVLVALGEKKHEAPAVEGFPQAKCVLLDIVEERPDSPKPETIESLDCVAVEGDVLVTFRSYGPRPRFDVKTAIDLFTRQLNHLKSPGESV